jgi:hypothetical protein
MRLPGAGAHSLHKTSVLLALVYALVEGCTYVRSAPCASGPEGTCRSITSAHGVGLVIAQGHVTFGWMRELHLEFPNATDCRVVLFVERPKDVQAVEDLLAMTGSDLSKVCTVHP